MERSGQMHGTPAEGSDTGAEGKNEPRTILRFTAFVGSEAVYGAREDYDSRSMFY